MIIMFPLHMPFDNYKLQLCLRADEHLQILVAPKFASCLRLISAI